MQKNQQGGNASQGRNDQQNQQSGNQPQQGGQHGKQTPSGGSNQQSQSGAGRDQQGGNLKSDPGQAHSRDAQHGGDAGSRSNKQR